MKVFVILSFVVVALLKGDFVLSQNDSVPPVNTGSANAEVSEGVNPTASWEAFNRGETKRAANKLDAAITEFDKAITINPDFYQAAIARGGTKFLKYDFQAALNDYDMAIQIIEKLTETYMTKSEIKNVLGDADGAVREMDNLNKLKPFLAEAYYRRGSVKKFLSQKDASCTDFNKAMEMGYPKAETSMKQYCGYVSPASGGGAKGSGATKTNTPKNNASNDTTKTIPPTPKK